MITDELQLRIHKGDTEAFRSLYEKNAKGVYQLALKALGTDAMAKEVVKATFLTLRQELLAAQGPMDVEARISALTQQAILARQSADQPDKTAKESHATAELPPLERTWAYMKSDPEQPAPKEAAPATTDASTGRHIGAGILKTLIILFLLLFIWVLIGILMDLHILPTLDLGYGWFNRNVFALFNI